MGVLSDLLVGIFERKGIGRDKKTDDRRSVLLNLSTDNLRSPVYVVSAICVPFGFRHFFFTLYYMITRAILYNKV